MCSKSHTFARTVYMEKIRVRGRRGEWGRHRQSSFIRSVGVKSAVNNAVWFMAPAPLYESPYCARRRPDWDSFWPLSRVFFPGFSSHGLWPPPQLYSLPISVQKSHVWKQCCECAPLSWCLYIYTLKRKAGVGFTLKPFSLRNWISQIIRKKASTLSEKSTKAFTGTVPCTFLF